MRKGNSLIELLGVMAIMIIISVPLAGLWRALVYDVPMAGNRVQQRAQLNNVINSIKQDINKAVDFPENTTGSISETESLLIRSAGELISYQVDDKRITRYIYDGANWVTSSSWYIPNAKIDYQILYENGKPHTIILKNYIEHKEGRNIQKKFANAHLFFIGTMPE